MRTRSRIAPSTAETITGFLKPLAASGVVPQSEIRSVSRLLMDAAKPTVATIPVKVKPKLLTASQAAERLNCCKRSIFRMADQGRLKRIHLKPGSAKSVRFREAEIEKIINGEEVDNEEK